MKYTMHDAIGKILIGLIEEQKKSICDLPSINYNRHIELRGLEAFHRGIKAVLVTEELIELERAKERLGISMTDFRYITTSVELAKDYYNHLNNVELNIRQG